MGGEPPYPLYVRLGGGRVAEMEPIEVTEKIRNELILLAKRVKDGEITPTVGNSLANIYKAALYAEQVRAQKANGLEVKVDQSGELELSQADKDRLDDIAVLLAGGKPKKRGKGAGKSGNNKA
jgi:hypothetical protein